MTRPVLAIAFLLGVMPASSAFAQWQFSSGIAIRQVQMTETDANGQQLVREHGVLPGLEARADYLLRDWRLSVMGETYRNTIRYDGHLQNGALFATDTDATQHRIGIEIGRQFNEATRLIGALEWDRWQRHILGRNVALGLHERYTSWRLLAGGETCVLQWPAARIDAKGLIVFAQPEQLHVRFDNRVFDDAHFSTRSAIGLRMVFAMLPAGLPNLSVTADIDWLTIGRSDDAVLQKNGLPAGTVSQAKHQRRAFSVRANYRF